MHNIAIVVPARLSSQRLPKKLLHKIRGKQLILWTAERIKSVAREIPLYFAVADKQLKNLLEKRGYNVVMTDKNLPSGTDRIAQANETIKANCIINIQADEPLVTADHIQTLSQMILNTGVIVTLVTPLKNEAEFNDPNKVKAICAKNRALYFTRSPAPYYREKKGKVNKKILAEMPYFKHLGMYAYTKNFLEKYRNMPQGKLEQLEQLEQLRALENGFSIAVGYTEDSSIGIDTIEDVKVFEKYLEKNKK